MSILEMGTLWRVRSMSLLLRDPQDGWRDAHEVAIPLRTPSGSPAERQQR
ncbi:MAG: hypothetical protein HQ478_01675 [Chloroflexi bacterium]|nr:hypothetical protein [Chloroflexota bacterium]